MRWTLALSSDETARVELLRQDGKSYTFKVFLDGRQKSAEIVGEEIELTLEEYYQFSIQCVGEERMTFEVWNPQRWRAISGCSVLEVLPVRQSTEENSELRAIHSPMPGRILRILIEPGAQVKKGQTLMIIEAMKMENEVRAPQDLHIDSINVKASDSVEEGQCLLEVSPSAGS